MPQPDVENLWRLVVECSPTGMALLDADGAVVRVNQVLRDLLGCTDGELCERGLLRVSHPADEDRVLGLLRRARAGDVSCERFSQRYLHADGSVVWGDVAITALPDEDGEPVHLLAQIADVTARHLHDERTAQATYDVEREQTMAQAILDTADVGLVLLDRTGRYERMNRRHADFMALAFPEGHRGRAGQEGAIYDADGTTLVQREDMPSSRALRGEEFDDHRIWVGADPASRRALSVSGRRVLTAAGDVVGATLAYNDITDLMNAVRAREDFVAMVSHELRTPLASVLGHLELVMSSGVALDEDTRSSLEVMHRNGMRLRGLVADLLESAQRNGPMSLARRRCDLEVVVRDVVDAARPPARGRDVELTVDLDATSGPTHAFVDEQRLRQVVENLVANAVKYTAAGGRVHVSLRGGAHEVALVVADTGVGIEAGDIDRIFLPFVRTETARTLRAPGIGLGLSIVDKIVDAHHGTIDVVSASGEGSTFTVRIPSGRGDVDAPRAASTTRPRRTPAPSPSPR